MDLRYISTERLKKIMSARGIASISELSRQSNIHRNSLSPYLKQEKSILNEVTEKIAKALQVDPLLLVERREVGSLDPFKVIPKIKKYSLSLNEKHCFFLFGSRASGLAKEYSDYDIAYAGISGERGLEIKEDILNLFQDLPVKIDLVNFDNAPAWFYFECKPNFIFISGVRSFYYSSLSKVYEAKE